MKVNGKMKRALSILLCLCMVLQYAPSAVFAAEEDSSCEHTSYSEEAVAATCQTPGHTQYTCDACGYSYNEYLSYSEWSAERPTGIADDLVRTATQYRSAVKDIQTSSEGAMDGYTLVGTDWNSGTQQTNDYANFAGTGFDTTSDLYAQYQPVSAYEDETRKVVLDSETAKTGYLYYHWCSTDSSWALEASSGSHTTFHAYYDTTDPSNYNCDTSDMSYKTSHSSCSNSAWWFVLDVNTQNYTVYELVNVFEKLGDWSEWGFDEIQPSDTTVVDTREVYRYANGELDDHTFGTDGKCTVCGAPAPTYTVSATRSAMGNDPSPYITLSNTTATAGQDFQTVLNFSVGSGVKVGYVFHASQSHMNPIEDYTYDPATRTLTVPAEYITEDIEIYAYPTVAVTLDGNGGTLAEGYEEPVIIHNMYNNTISVPTDVYTREGMYIRAWTDSEGNSYGTRQYITEDITLYAQWECNEHGESVYKELDAYYHKKVCTVCGAFMGYEVHVMGTNGECTGCGAEAAAKIGDTYYVTLSAAAEKAVSGETITVLADVTIAEDETITFAEGVTLKVAEGKTVTCNGTVKIGEKDGIIVGNQLYYYGGDVTNTGLDMAESLNANTYYTAGEGYVLWLGEGVVELHNAQISGSEYALYAQRHSTAQPFTIRFYGENELVSAHDTIMLITSDDDIPLTLEAGDDNAVLNVQSESCGIRCGQLTVKNGTVNITCVDPETDGNYSVGISAEGLTVEEDAQVNVSCGNCEIQSMAVGVENSGTVTVNGTLNTGFGTAQFAAGIFCGKLVVGENGTVNALAITYVVETDPETGEVTATTFAYYTVGDAVISADTTALVMDGMTATFTVPSGTSLTVNSGVTLDLSGLAIDNIKFLGTVTNNGTIKLPAAYTYDTIPEKLNGAVAIGEDSYTWNGEKWICDENTHTGGTATCTEKAVCDFCGTAYGEKAKGNHASTEYIYTPNEDGTTHTKKYKCCETIADAAEAHTLALTYENLGSEGHKAYYPCCQKAEDVQAVTHTYESGICACTDVEEFTLSFYASRGDETPVATFSVPYGTELAAYSYDEEADEETFLGATDYLKNLLSQIDTSGLQKEHYTFTRWDVESGPDCMYDDGNIYGIWSPVEYSITWDFAGGEELTEAPASVPYGDTIMVGDWFSREGHTFSHLVDQNGSKYYDSTPNSDMRRFGLMPGYDLTLTAVWDVNSYTLHAQGQSLNVEYGTDLADALSAFTPAKTGYTFTGWKFYLDESCTEEYTGSTMPAQTLYAQPQLEAIEYNIIWDMSGCSYELSNYSELPRKLAYNVDGYEHNVNFADITAPAGYEFVRFEDGDGNTLSCTFTDRYRLYLTVSGDMTVKAVIQPKTYMATWESGDGDSYEKKFKYGETISIPTSEIFQDTFRKAGYTLTGWEGYAEGMTMPVDGVTFTAKWQINPASLEVSSGTYTGQAHTPTVTVEGLTEGEDFTVEYPSNMTDAGEKIITVTGILGGTTTVTYTIEKVAAPVITFPTVQNEITYGAQLQEVQLSFYRNDYGEFQWTAPNGTPNAGTGNYALDFYPSDAALNNFEWTDAANAQWIESRNALCITAPVTVNKAEPEFEYPGFDQRNPPTYNGNMQALVTPGSTEHGTMVYSLSEDGPYTESVPMVRDAGEYRIWFKIIGDENHTDTQPQSIDTWMELAPLWVTAKDHTITYGDAPVGAGVIYEGFVGGDTEAVLGGELTYSYGYEQYGDVGTYTITPGGLESGNYTVLYTDGTLTVEPKSIDANSVALNGSLTYTGSEQTQKVAAAEGITFAVTGNKATDAGTYELTVTGTGNYTGTVTRKWTIAKAEQTVTVAENLELSCAESAQLTAQAEGALTFASSDASVVTVDASGKLTAKKPGSAVITISAAENKNYLAAQTTSRITVKHAYEEVVTAPTCEAKGYTTYTCACGDSYVKDYTNPQGHVFTDDWDEFCNVCDEARKILTVPMYRLYNPNSGEHFYTGSTEERDVLVEAGWKYEGVAWNAPVYIGDPVYRFFNPNTGDHHYTMDLDECASVRAAGWIYEGVAWNSAPDTGIPNYRLYNPNAETGIHHYTGSVEERDWLVSLGWEYEGIGWYGLLK